MRISTRNPGGRSIVRVDQRSHDLNWGYWLTDDRLPSIQLRLDGNDGKTYTVVLTQDDIDALNAARGRYDEHFQKPKG